MFYFHLSDYFTLMNPWESVQVPTEGYGSGISKVQQQSCSGRQLIAPWDRRWHAQESSLGGTSKRVSLKRGRCSRRESEGM